jgi:putative ABC transporter-associated repeat protein
VAATSGPAATPPAPGQSAPPVGQLVSEGHFDFGARVQDGELVALIKDDRSAPPVWRDPSALVFKLGDAAKKSLPAGLDFIGSAGTEVHMIGQVQEAQVPWLGWNTQAEEIVTGTTGPVTMTLEGVDGPGKLAVFLGGSFGGVGQRVFDNVGGPTSYEVPLNTHQHGNWVFTEPGTYRVKVGFAANLKEGGAKKASNTLVFAVGEGTQPQNDQSVPPSTSPTPTQPAAGSTPRVTTVNKVVGRTASGAECQLPPNAAGADSTLPSTGAGGGLLPLLVGGALLVAGGGAVTIVALRRRGKHVA